MLLVLSNKGKGMQSSSEKPLIGEEHCVTTRITAAKGTTFCRDCDAFFGLKWSRAKMYFSPLK